MKEPNDASHPVDVYALVRNGDDLILGGKYQEAIDIFNKVIGERDVNYSYALRRKGTSLLKLGRYEEAIEIFDGLHAHEDKGVALAMWGKYQGAIEIFNKALKSNTNDTNVLSDRNAVLRALKRQKEGGRNTEFHQGHVSYKPEPGEDRIKFIDLFAALFGSRMLLDEPERKLQAVCQDMVDRWSEFTPEAQKRQYEILESLKVKELSLGLKDKITHSPTNFQENKIGPMLDSDTVSLIQILLVLAGIFIFLVGLATVFGGGLKN